MRDLAMDQGRKTGVLGLGKPGENTQYCLRRALGCPGAYNLLTIPSWKPRLGYSPVSLAWALSSCTVYPVLQGPEVCLSGPATFLAILSPRGKKEKSLVVVFEAGLFCLNAPASETGQTVTVTAPCLGKVF